jgi:hypothetical protein
LPVVAAVVALKVLVAVQEVTELRLELLVVALRQNRRLVF